MESTVRPRKSAHPLVRGKRVLSREEILHWIVTSEPPFKYDPAPQENKCNGIAEQNRGPSVTKENVADRLRRRRPTKVDNAPLANVKCMNSEVGAFNKCERILLENARDGAKKCMDDIPRMEFDSDSSVLTVNYIRSVKRAKRERC